MGSTGDVVFHSNIDDLGSLSYLSQLTEIIRRQRQPIEQFRGNWFKNESLLGNYFIAENEVSELHELYISLFPISDRFDNNLTQAINEIELEAVEEHVDLAYLEWFLPNKFPMSSLANSGFEKWELVATFVEREIDIVGDSPVCPPGFNIRFARLSDCEDIVNCLVEAYVAGLTKQQRKLVSPILIERKVRQMYSTLLSQERIVLICERMGEFCGHVTYELPSQEHETGGYEVNLLDAFTVSKYRQQGLSRALVAFGEMECAKKGYKRVVGSVEGSSDSSVLTTLLRSGWSLRSRVLIKSLRGES